MCKAPYCATTFLSYVSEGGKILHTKPHFTLARYIVIKNVGLEIWQYVLTIALMGKGALTGTLLQSKTGR